MSRRLALTSLLICFSVLGSGLARSQGTTAEPSPAATAPAPDATPALPPPAAVPAPATPAPAPIVAAPSPAAPNAATPAAVARPTEHGTPATVLSLEDSDGIIGKSVKSASGDDMGRIVDVIVSGNNRPRAAIIDFGGFLGVGSRKIAVDWEAVQFAADGRSGSVTLALSRNQVRSSPEYKPGEPIVVLHSQPPTQTPPATLAAAPKPEVAPAADGAAAPAKAP